MDPVSKTELFMSYIYMETVLIFLNPDIKQN